MIRPAKDRKLPILLLCLLFIGACTARTGKDVSTQKASPVAAPLKTGDQQMDLYVPLLRGKRVAVVTNPTGEVSGVSIVDTLLSRKIKVVRVFAPEHGFRGTSDAGAKVKDQIDPQTGLPVISLYGEKKSPSATDLQNVDEVVFDIQDVGARFYTYIATLELVMKSCAENNKPLMVLDRPNPNAHYVDGPVLDTNYRSFVGMDPVPVVYGMTIGEYAQMINGEGWLGNGLRAELNVIKCANYTHQTRYTLPVDPSPNLRSMRSIYLYPSLCFFEGTEVSVGRGTKTPFEVCGYPGSNVGRYYFTPISMPGATNPPWEGKKCQGLDLSHLPVDSLSQMNQLTLKWLVLFLQKSPHLRKFFNHPKFFDLLAGTDQLRKQLLAGKTVAEIRESWQPELAEFRKIRAKYLLYPEGNK